MTAMSHPENDRYLEDLRVQFDMALLHEQYFEALTIVRELRSNGFMSEAMSLWERLYSELGEDYERLLQ